MSTSPLAHLVTRWRRALSVALALLLVFGAFPSGPAQAETRPRALKQLEREAAAAPERTFRVLVGRAGRGRDADAYLAGRGQRKVKDLGRMGFVAEVKGREVAALARHRGVRWVTLDAAVVPTATVDSTQLATVFDQTLNATSLWSSGITGQGVGIAVLDTGVDQGSADFRDPATGASRVVATVNTNASAAAKADGYGHGTHVAAIAAGNSWAQAPGSAARGKYVGVAPGARVINVRASDDAGRTYVSDVIEGIDWVIANRQAHNIRVLNLSLQSTVAESAATSYLAAAAQRAWLNGILVVVAAGNQGADQALYPPGNDPFVVTVGAADPVGTAGRADDGMAPWSTYGTTQEGHAKPDVVAPGRRIAANLAPGSVLGAAFPERVQDGSYVWLSGSSMAAPQVAGVGALAFQRSPGLTNNALKWLLLNTATRLGGASPLAGQGAGLVDAQAAVTYAGTPGVANTGLPINRHLVGPDGATVYTASATTPSGASWSESGWDSTSWSESGWDSTDWAESGWDSSGWQAAPQSTAGARLE